MHPGAVSTKSTVCQEVLFALKSIMLVLLFCLFFFFLLHFSFPEKQLFGFIFMEAREENCSFAAELLFVSYPSPSHLTASASPSHLLEGA